MARVRGDDLAQHVISRSLVYIELIGNVWPSIVVGDPGISYKIDFIAKRAGEGGRGVGSCPKINPQAPVGAEFRRWNSRIQRYNVTVSEIKKLRMHLVLPTNESVYQLF